MSPFKFDCGQRVKDLVTGFAGIVISRTEYLNRCIRYGVQSDKLKDGQPSDAAYFDEEQLVADGRKPSIAIVKPARTGGPHDAPRRHADVMR